MRSLMLASLTLLPALIAGAEGDDAVGRERRLALEKSPVALPAYRSLMGEELCGSGFILQSGEKRLAVASLHQFDGKAPKVMHLDIDDMDRFGDDPLAVTLRVHLQADVQILAFTHPKLAELPALPYAGPLPLRDGDRLTVWLDGPVEGDLIKARNPQEPHLRFLRLVKPAPAAGCSGSAVVLASTHTVIGVVLTADDGDAATVIGFEPLTLPEAQP